ncbi:DUF2059 domain-containing protein [Zhouia sp. PK063]|uniref:DUF2059 domain-containing protein n=1 Tax=Zhouia sp. PK063 TaxID=3373602 RepID=UPI0037A06AA2
MAKKIIFIVAVLLLSSSAFAQEKDAYEAKLKEYFEVSGSNAAFEKSIIGMLDMIKQQYPQVKDEYWNAAKEEMIHTSMSDLAKMLVPVYKKHLSVTDLDAIIKFYKSPAGKKIALATPDIMAESMQVGQQWGAQVAQKVQAKLKQQSN